MTRYNEPGQSPMGVWREYLESNRCVCQVLQIRVGQTGPLMRDGVRGKADSVVLSTARATDRILLTLAKGIANIARYPAEVHAAVVLFRPGSSGRGGVLAFVLQRLPALLERNLSTRLCVVTSTAMRVR